MGMDPTVTMRKPFPKVLNFVMAIWISSKLYRFFFVLLFLLEDDDVVDVDIDDDILNFVVRCPKSF